PIESLSQLLQDGMICKFTNAVCKSYNESLNKINLCRIRAVDRYKNTFNFNSTVLQPIYEIKTRVKWFKRANGYKPWLYDVTFDGCQFVKKPTNAVAIYMLSQFRNYTNILDQQCPILGTKVITGFYLNPMLTKLPYPTGDYLIHTAWTLNKKLTVVVNISIQFTEDL
ncbi:hypothetical protein KR222_007415, partial [Zaprionus bogoriensis]